jgi:hypothetical protein
MPTAASRTTRAPAGSAHRLCEPAGARCTGASPGAGAVGGTGAGVGPIRPPTKAEGSHGNGGVRFTNPGAVRVGQPEPSSSTKRAPTSPHQPSRPVPTDPAGPQVLRNGGDDDRRCLDLDVASTVYGGRDYGAYRDLARRSQIPECERATAAVPTPAEVAEAFVREIPLPVPEPRIAPNGTAITGLAAYLETNGTLSHAVETSPTPLGPIQVEATSVYWVDWGTAAPRPAPSPSRARPTPAVASGTATATGATTPSPCARPGPPSGDSVPTRAPSRASRPRRRSPSMWTRSKRSSAIRAESRLLQRVRRWAARLRTCVNQSSG